MSHGRRHVGLKLALALAPLLIIGTFIVAQPPTPRRDPYAELEMLSRLNEWRLSEGLDPLKRNTTLDALAYFQAAYVSTLRPYPDGVQIHRGRINDLPKERARWEPFLWPPYGTSAQIAVEEIAAIRNLNSSIDFWKGSPAHRHAATNPTYREVGIAALPISFGRYIYIVVLGSRPGVLPSLYDPTTRMLRQTVERYPYSTDNKNLKFPTKVKFYNEFGLPMLNGAWIDWAEEIPLPSRAGRKLYMLLSDDTYESLIEVDLSSDLVWIPTLVPTVTPTPTFTLTYTPSRTPTPRITNTPTLTLTPTPVPGPELLLLYDEDVLTVINFERYPADLRDVSLVGATFTLPMYWWSTINTFAFQSGSCVQAYAGGISPSPSRPRECRVVRESRGRLFPDQRFWLTGTFDVKLNNEVIATCEASAGRCVVDLPNQP
ncbi:MAG: hypothetical protein UZ13_02650 [Chloroflexi bacterium OLB13]|nr:MAG: hypothetical protein UZ13_02650 [Chloroflexi bacterium OLB13]